MCAKWEVKFLVMLCEVLTKEGGVKFAMLDPKLKGSISTKLIKN